MMKMNKITDDVIIKAVNRVANDKNVKTPFSCSLFFLYLFRAAEESKSNCLIKSIKDFVSESKLSQTTIESAIKVLEYCNLITRADNDSSNIKKTYINNELIRSVIIMTKAKEIFNSEELNILNNLKDLKNFKSFTKEDLIKNIDFIISISEDENILNLYQDTKDKLESLSDEDWENIKSLLPFETFSGDEELDEEIQ